MNLVLSCRFGKLVFLPVSASGVYFYPLTGQEQRYVRGGVLRRSNGDTEVWRWYWSLGHDNDNVRYTA